MQINNLKLNNFRNYEFCDIDFNSKINLITGSNGQGKTNLIEGIAYFSTIKSFRDNLDGELIMKNKENAILEAITTIGGRNYIYKIVLTSKGRKIYINDSEIKRLSDIVGIFNVITLNYCF
jgi:DNA replication and repair protein RecF